MSDFRDPNDPLRSSNDPLRDPNDPMRREWIEPAAGRMNATWGWIAAAVFVVIVLAIAFGIGHRPSPGDTNTASNDTMPPAVNRMAPPTTAPPPVTATPPVTAPAPIAPVPNNTVQH